MYWAYYMSILDRTATIPYGNSARMSKDLRQLSNKL
jgi:hypothetical protein